MPDVYVSLHNQFPHSSSTRSVRLPFQSRRQRHRDSRDLRERRSDQPPGQRAAADADPPSRCGLRQQRRRWSQQRRRQSQEEAPQILLNPPTKRCRFSERIWKIAPLSQR